MKVKWLADRLERLDDWITEALPAEGRHGEPAEWVGAAHEDGALAVLEINGRDFGLCWRSATHSDDILRAYLRAMRVAGFAVAKIGGVWRESVVEARQQGVTVLLDAPVAVLHRVVAVEID